MAIRNFWIKLKIDGKQKMIQASPRSADGGFEMTIGMRNKDGSICEYEVEINGFAKVNEKDRRKRDLRIEVGDSSTSDVIEYENE